MYGMEENQAKKNDEEEGRKEEEGISVSLTLNGRKRKRGGRKGEGRNDISFSLLTLSCLSLYHYFLPHLLSCSPPLSSCLFLLSSEEEEEGKK